MKRIVYFLIAALLFTSCSTLEKTISKTKDKSSSDSLVVEKQKVVIERKVDTVVYTERITDTVLVYLHDTIVQTVVDNAGVKVRLQKVNDKVKVITDVKPQEVKLQFDEKISVDSYKKIEKSKKETKVENNQFKERKETSFVIWFLITLALVVYCIYKIIKGHL